MTALTRAEPVVERVPAPTRLDYRPALDGLRTVAVYLVVAYHAGLGVFAGGFIGVDLFFALSGFLVTSVILVQLDGGSFSVIAFYARRIRRLLPAATLVLVASSLLVVGLSPPAQREAAIGDVRSAFLYVSNWHFLVQAKDYFAANAAPGPFLHFWSLSIEEQFYFAFPLLVLGVVALARRCGWSRRWSLATVFAGLGAVSLFLQIDAASGDPSKAYYATQTRLYQLLAGALLAVLLSRSRSRRPTAGSAWGPVGVLALLGLVVTATSLVGWTPSTRGIAATTLSVLVLAAIELQSHTGIARGLAGDRLVYLGQISYGTYLWHWPLLWALRQVVVLSPIESFVIVGITATALAGLSHRFLEMPVRRSRRLDRHPLPVVLTGLTCSALFGIVLMPALLRSDTPMVLMSASTVRGDALAAAPVPKGVDWRRARQDNPLAPDCADRPATACIAVPGPGLKVHLVGDSHARTFLPMFTELARQRHWQLSITTENSCPWMRGLLYTDPEFQDGCRKAQADWYDRVIPELDPDVVVLVDRAKDDPQSPRRIVAEDGTDGTQTQLMSASIRRTIVSLAEEGRHVVVMKPLPVSAWSPTDCLSGARFLRDCTFTATPQVENSVASMRRVVSSQRAAKIVDIDRLVCPTLPNCVPIVDDIVVRRDGDHITASFARHIARRVGRLLDRTGFFTAP